MSAPPPPPPGYNPQFVPRPPANAPAPPPAVYPWAAPGYVVPPAARPPVKHTSHTKLLAFLAIGLLVIVAGFVVISKVATPTTKTVKCPPTCPQPPVGAPVSALPRFSAKDGAFSVSYYPQNSAVSVTTDADSVTEKITPSNGEDGTIVLLGKKANGQTAEQVVSAIVADAFPDGERAYVIPNAVVGYRPGYGEILDVYPQSTSGGYSRQRVIVMAAVKNDVALVAVALGKYHEFSPDGLTDGHASGANVFVALLLDRLLNSFTWKGDPPR